MQLFQNICFLDLGEGEAGEAWASSCRGYGAVGLGWGSAELLAVVGVARILAWPAVEMLIEILDYRRCIGGDSVT